ncbi:MAG TPA: alpha/beta fold hydrolase [Micromonosporaceae bacterium]|nr:alpha/beta fold hydrolase [Micromonosporaceae bacterium]
MMTLLSAPTVIGPERRAPLLLLHALGADRRLWHDLAALLPDRTLLAYEFPGHGLAPMPDEPFTIHDLAEQVAEALRTGGWGPAHVLGVSLGGLVAQDLAAHHPELVDALVLVDTVATYPPEQVARWQERAALVRTAGTAPIIEATLQTWFTADFLATDSPQIELVRTMLTAVDPEGYARACETLAGADTRELVDRITAPTLVVCGDDDMPPFLEAARWLAATIPQAGLCWLSPARHMGLLELPQQLAAGLSTFFDGR